jgi:hypothetical protein
VCNELVDDNVRLGGQVYFRNMSDIQRALDALETASSGVREAIDALGDPSHNIQDALDVAAGRDITCGYTVNPEGRGERRCILMRRHAPPHTDGEGWFGDSGLSAEA